MSTMATANTALNRPRGPALIPPQTPPGTTTQPPKHATFCAPLFIHMLENNVQYHQSCLINKPKLNTESIALNQRINSISPT